MKALDREKIQYAKSMRENGKSVKEIASHFDVSRQAIHKWLNVEDKYFEAYDQLRDIEDMIDIITAQVRKVKKTLRGT